MRSLLRPTNDYAPDAILPGDPGVALALAQELIDGPLMANHARGLWGYTGPAKPGTGESLSIQSTGYGNQSAAAVLTQLAGLGVRRAIRIGTCVAPDGALEVGSQIVVGTATGHDARPHVGSEELTAFLSAAHPDRPEPMAVVSVDTLEYARAINAGDAVAVDGTTAGLFGAAGGAGVAVAAALLVIKTGSGELDDLEVEAGVVGLGRVAWQALAAGYVDVAGVKRR